MYFYIFLILLIGLQDCYALRDVSIRFLDTVNVGDNITLFCNYDLEGQKLYSVKWYKNEEEFFRYIPHDVPSLHEFPVEHLQISYLNATAATSVSLIDVLKEAEADYACEVSIEAPTFEIAIDIKHLHVEVENKPLLFVEPKYGFPLTTVIPNIVNINDTINLLCSYNITKHRKMVYIKWLKDNEVIYNYNSNGSTEIRTVPGVNLSAKQTNNSIELILHNINFDATGKYTCEMEADNPFEMNANFGYVLIPITPIKPVLVKISKEKDIEPSAKLLCHYNIDKTKDFTVKWFKANREFFRYSSISEKVDITALNGVIVEDLIKNKVDRKFFSEILLKNITLETVGRYRCEVNIEKDNDVFQDSEILTINYIPLEEPTLLVDSDLVRQNDRLHAICSSSSSYPPANITWLLNNKTVNEKNSTTYSYNTYGLPVPVSSVLDLEIDFFYENVFSISDKMILTCIISIGDDYRKEKTVTLDVDYKNFLLESKDDVWHYKIK